MPIFAPFLCKVSKKFCSFDKLRNFTSVIRVNSGGRPKFFSCAKLCGQGYFLATKTLVESIWHYIRDPSGVFSVCHAREWHIDKFSPFFMLLFSKWPTISRFVELNEDDIYHFCEQQNKCCLL